MQIKKMPISERPAAKMLYGGAKSLSNAELLSLILRTGNKEQSAVSLAEDVFNHAYECSGDIGLAEVRELMEVPGVGEAKACAVSAAFELGKRVSLERQARRSKRVVDSRGVYDLLYPEVDGLKQERFYALLLNAKMEIISKELVSIGTVDSAPVHPRDVFSPAIRKGAAAIIAAHNHPTGDPTPSPQDIEVTLRLKEAGKIMGIKLLDHVVIGRGSFISLKNEGYLDETI